MGFGGTDGLIGGYFFIEVSTKRVKNDTSQHMGQGFLLVRNFWTFMDITAEPEDRLFFLLCKQVRVPLSQCYPLTDLHTHLRLHLLLTCDFTCALT